MSDPDVESHQRPFIQAYNLRRLRAKRGLTQAELARRAGVPRITATRAEGGTVKTDVEALEKLARALCVPLDDLLKRPPRGAEIVKRPGNRKAVRQ